MYFTRSFTDKLYIAQNTTGDSGFMALVTPVNAPDKAQISLTEALTNNNWGGSFTISAKAPEITNKAQADAFVNAISNVVGITRQFIWLRDVNNLTSNNMFNAQFSASGNSASLNTGLTTVLTPTLNFLIRNGANIIPDDNDNALLFSGTVIGFDGASAPKMYQVTDAILPCTGATRGCIQFTGFIERTSLLNSMQWGFQLLIPDGNGGTQSAWQPFVNPNVGPAEYIGFNISIDPTDVFNEVFDPCNGNECAIPAAYASRRTFFDFTGKNFLGNDVRLVSYYTTVFGYNVTLLPGTTANATYNARLVFSLSDKGGTSFVGFHLSPEGDFIIALPDTAGQDNYYFLCGMSGTEFFKVTPQVNNAKGDIIRFLSRRPAYVPIYPLPLASPVAAPIDLNQSPLNTVFRTSWATVVNNSGNGVFYVSQPAGASLYGTDKLIEPKFNDLLGHTTPGFQFSATDSSFFPMFPYTGMKSDYSVIPTSDVKGLEKTVVSPERRRIIAGFTNNTKGNGDQKNETTPSGIISDITQNDQGAIIKWNEFTLGWNIDNGVKYTLAFKDPPVPLVNALQSSDVMLVVANNKNLGNFLNDMSIGSWLMEIDTGVDQAYNDYKNVILLKGRRGKLYDAANPANSLVANPLNWTQSRDFAIPNDDEAQLVILSQWIQNYFFDAAQQSGNPYFDKFNSIAGDENWTGILFLRINVKDVPVNLKGIMAGITDPTAFNAHHLGIEISPVKKGANGPVADHPAAIFGLIYYLDPEFSDQAPVTTIAPSTNEDYDYRLLSLKVLFENTAVKSFESYAQLTLNKILGSSVTNMLNPDNIYHNILLTGTLQINNGNPLYTLSSRDDDAFYLKSNIIRRVEINHVMLSTRSAADAVETQCWFALSGFIDYFALKDDTTEDVFDIFSFGNKNEEDIPGQGLAFSNLGISMTFPAIDPANSTLTFSTAEITFDLSHSTPRTNSLYTNMLLDMESLQTGTATSTPKDNGYLEVLPDLRMSGVTGQEWLGLRMKLNMGTPGELAGKVGLNSWLLLYWSPDSTDETGYRAGISISLPGTESGAKLISLQNVMKLSIGQIRLLYIKDKQSFLLLFTDIALKFIGLLKIPSGGNTLFYLFGNPGAGGKTSGLGWYAMYAKDAVKLNTQTTTKAKVHEPQLLEQ